jgi:hypothetical protein
MRCARRCVNRPFHARQRTILAFRKKNHLVASVPCEVCRQVAKLAGHVLMNEKQLHQILGGPFGRSVSP